jgi:hypothetical protein
MVWERRRSITDAGVELVYSIKNHGVGPAIIRDRFFLVNGQRFNASTTHGDEVLELSQALLRNKIPYFLREHGLPGKRTTIPQNGEHVIVRLHFPAVVAPQVDLVLSQLDEVIFCLEYESLYKKYFEMKEAV